MCSQVTSLLDFLRDERTECNARLGSGQSEFVIFYVSLLFFGFKCLVFMFTSKPK